MPVDFSILLKSLQRKKLEYETALDAINQTFEDLGLGVSTIVGHGQGGIAERAEIQRSGIRIKGELSFRGKDKAEEYFRLLDRDNDKFLSYEDVRAIEAFNSRDTFVRDGTFQSSASWSIAMLNDRVPVQQGKFLNLRAFLRHRQQIDDRQPLSKELLHVGMSLLPAYLEHWTRLKQLMKEQIASRDVRVSLAQADKGALDNVITIGELHEVLGACGTPLSTPELVFFLRTLRIMRIAQVELLRTYAKRRLAQPDFPFEIATVRVAVRSAEQPSRASTSPSTSRPGSRRRSKKRPDDDGDADYVEEPRLVTTLRSEDFAVDPEHLSQAPIGQALAWILRYFPMRALTPQSANLSSLQSPQSPAEACFDFSSFGRLCLSVRSHLSLGLRKVEQACRFLFDLAGHLNDRLVFRDLSALLYDRHAHGQRSGRHAKPVTGLSALPNALTETAVYKFSLAIGDASVAGGGGGGGGGADAPTLTGVSVHWKLARSESVEAAAKRLGGVPAGAGLVVSIDLLCRDPSSSPAPCVSLQHEAGRDDAASREAQWKAGATLIRAWLLAQLTDTVCKEHNVNFMGANVIYAVSELDDAPVYRVLLFYKRLVCVDRWLETLLLPFTLTDLMPACAGDVRTSLDLHHLATSAAAASPGGAADALAHALSTARSATGSNTARSSATAHTGVSSAHSTRSRHLRHGSTGASLRGQDLAQDSLADGPSLNDLFHCQVTGTLGLRAKLLSALLQRLTTALSSGLSAAQTAYLQSQTSHQPPAASSDASTSASSVATTGTADSASGETKRATKDDEEMRFRRWRSVHPFYKWLHGHAQHWAATLRRWASGTFRWHYRSLFDLMTRLSLTSTSPDGGTEAADGWARWIGSGFALWRRVSDELLLSPGGVPRHIGRLRARWAEDLAALHASCAERLQRQRELEQQRRREMLIHGKSSLAAASSVAEPPAAAMTQADRLLQATQHLRSTESLEQQAAQEDFERTVQSLRVLELLQRHCLGVHSAELLVGKARFTLSCAGLDVCEALLPDTPPMLRTFAMHEKELNGLRSAHRTAQKQL